MLEYKQLLLDWVYGSLYYAHMFYLVWTSQLLSMLTGTSDFLRRGRSWSMAWGTGDAVSLMAHNMIRLKNITHVLKESWYLGGPGVTLRGEIWGSMILSEVNLEAATCLQQTSICESTRDMGVAVTLRWDLSRPPLKLTGITCRPCRAAKDTDWMIRSHQQFFEIVLDTCVYLLLNKELLCVYVFRSGRRPSYVVVFWTSIAYPL